MNYQVQVEVPENDIRSAADLEKVPIPVNEGSLPLDTFASVTPGTQVAEYDPLQPGPNVNGHGQFAGTGPGSRGLGGSPKFWSLFTALSPRESRSTCGARSPRYGK